MASNRDRRGESALVRSARSLLQLSDVRNHLVVFGEPAHLVFAPHRLAVDVDIKNTARTFQQLGRHVELLFDLVRQTGGSRQIVSLRAVFDGNVH